jgi:HAE1 family hydrophobic/amphiphilic exporter-1
VLHGINLVRDGYARIVQRLIRIALVSVPLVVLIGAGIFGLARITPTSFLPEEDQGAFFLNIQLPPGASVARTSETVRQVEAILKKMPQVQDVFAVIGFSLLDGANTSNAAFAVAKLKPFEDRRGAADSAQALIRQMSPRVRRCAPPISSLSTCRRSSACRPAAASSTSSRRWRAGPGAAGRGHAGAGRRGQPGPAAQPRVLDLHREHPSIYLDIDRDKAQALGLGMNDVFTALQSTLGGCSSTTSTSTVAPGR